MGAIHRGEALVLVDRGQRPASGAYLRVELRDPDLYADEARELRDELTDWLERTGNDRP